ncbi:MAG: carboxypeptidase-like regulatory domain-containing protein [Bacteroidota bacterium]|nr:carboxypeptidase-like regulatory domain-containing protein [Rhodothermia bacterium]MCS7154781.1 carboxypeptidase-like regulatory domain-containing protein [Bacteroidota bacterium]MDW8137574.1 carboxypeptidase-like regulatory domain-containing protein [Bacteroidota bacterium]MDW8285472.1 carboxypeptidase-like regulatory domain-containing protein [Bacteroidota bacterium]
MIRRAGLIAFGLLFPFWAWAQTGKLAGRVTDARTGEPLPGASVVLEGTTLGTAADANGNYFILAIPPGIYTVRVSFVGYETRRIEGVVINANFTRELNVALREQVGQLGEVVVEYERPLIQKDAIGVPKIVDAEQIQNLPVRGVNSIAGLQGGVVQDERTGVLNVRGGRTDEVIYIVDGVRISAGALGVPQNAIQEQTMLIGGLPAEYGDAMSGVIQVTTREAGSRFFGTLEGISSQFLDPYGYNTTSFIIGGPLVGTRLGFVMSAEYNYRKDADPTPITMQTVPDSIFQKFLKRPRYIDAQGRLIRAPETNRTFVQTRVKPNNDAWNLNLVGRLSFRPLPGISLRVGGTYYQSLSDNWVLQRMLYNWDHNGRGERQDYRVYINWTHSLSASTFYQVQADYLRAYGKSYDPVYKDNLFAYGDPRFGLARGDTSAMYWYNKLDNDGDDDVTDRGDGFVKNPGAIEYPAITGIYRVMAEPGTVFNNYSFSQTEQFRVSANMTTQIGIHQVKFGGEFEQKILRGWAISPLVLYKRLAPLGVPLAEASLSKFRNGFRDIEDIISHYGYDALTRSKINPRWEEWFKPENRTNPPIAPFRPLYAAGFVQDKIEYRDLVLNIGVRVDWFNANQKVLKDPYALFPIEYQRPSWAKEELAVYYNNANQIVGYRDKRGNFYDKNGQASDGFTITRTLGGDVRFLANELRPEVFEDYKPELIVMPRIGFAFPVTDRAIFHAHYDVLTQRPSEGQLYASLEDFRDIAESGGLLPNANLRPMKTIEYELGFRQTLSERAVIGISGFYKQIKDLIQRRNIFFVRPFDYTGYQNVDFGTVKGATLEFQMRRTNNVSVDANYTLSFADGTGSDPNTLSLVTWVQGVVPNIISPLDFDQRHRINLNLDWRLGRGEGPAFGGVRLLENFGLNVLVQAASGRPYTRSKNVGPFWTSRTRAPLGGINGARMPWSTLVNLRLDRRFDMGQANLTVYLWIQNLLNSQNVRAVYPYTGVPNDDGFLATPEGRGELERVLDPISFVQHYRIRADNPNNYGIPRSVRLGVRVNF